MLIGKFTILRKHSAGANFLPQLMQNGFWQLRNAQGDTLAGYQGNAYNFKTEDNAKKWLCTNLARFNNADGVTDVEYVGQLHKIYSKNQLPHVLEDIETLAAWRRGEWEIRECESQVVVIDNSTKDWDGGNAYSIYN